MKCPSCDDELDPSEIAEAEAGDIIECLACGDCHEVTEVDVSATEPVKLRTLDEDELAELDEEDDEDEDDSDDEDDELEDEDEDPE